MRNQIKIKMNVKHKMSPLFNTYPKMKLSYKIFGSLSSKNSKTGDCGGVKNSSSPESHSSSEFGKD